MSTAYYDQEFRFDFAGAGITYMVRALILATTAAFALQMLAFIPFGMRHTLEYLAYSNDNLLRGWVWQPLTYMLLHGGLMHLFQNMLPLFFFGPTVERVLGSRQFLGLYLLCGVVGVLVNLYTIPIAEPSVTVLGASGATLGVLAAFVTIDPDRRVFILPFPFPITARGILVIIIAFNLVFALFQNSGVAVATHLAGIATGWAYMKLRPRWSEFQFKRRVRRANRPPSGPSPEEQDDLRKAVDNIFEMRDKFKKR